MKERCCAYCGKRNAHLTKDHVFPKSLYPPSKAGSRVQRLTVPACRQCNQRWSDDEAYFRDILAVAGEANAPRQELWKSKVLPSFGKVDGRRRVCDLFREMVSFKTSDGGTRYMVYPGRDGRVMRVVKKIIRGLSFYHEIASPLSEQQVWADVMTYSMPREALEQMKYHPREQDIAEYRYVVLNEDGINSWWLITFFNQVQFVGAVSISAAGLSWKGWHTGLQEPSNVTICRGIAQ